MREIDALKARLALAKSNLAKNEPHLIEQCKKFSGEYLSAFHGKGSWATTYSNEFIQAAVELYLLLRAAGYVNPVLELSRIFRKNGIRSCRGAEMTGNRVSYLIDAHMKNEMVRRNALAS
jgi:hypothetical protein